MWYGSCSLWLSNAYQVSSLSATTWEDENNITAAIVHKLVGGVTNSLPLHRMNRHWASQCSCGKTKKNAELHCRYVKFVLESDKKADSEGICRDSIEPDLQIAVRNSSILKFGFFLPYYIDLDLSAHMHRSCLLLKIWMTSVQTPSYEVINWFYCMSTIHQIY